MNEVVLSLLCGNWGLVGSVRCTRQIFYMPAGGSCSLQTLSPASSAVSESAGLHGGMQVERRVELIGGSPSSICLVSHYGVSFPLHILQKHF